jgi:hypothetical protein
LAALLPPFQHLCLALITPKKWREFKIFIGLRRDSAAIAPVAFRLAISLAARDARKAPQETSL